MCTRRDVVPQGIDFAQFPLDEPLPEIRTNASQTAFAAYLNGDRNQTLRDVLLYPCSGYLDFVGTPDRVAAEIGEAMQEIGCDGLLVTDPLTRRAISEVTDGLAPALKRRGLLRQNYEHTSSATICWHFSALKSPIASPAVIVIFPILQGGAAPCRATAPGQYPSRRR